MIFQTIHYNYYRCTILFDRDGNSISSAGDWPSSDQEICAAVAANIWLTLERASRINPNQLQVNAVYFQSPGGTVPLKLNNYQISSI